MDEDKPAAIWSRTKPGFLISTDQRLLDIETVHNYLGRESYWAKGISREKVERSIQHSLCFGVYVASDDPVKQVGFARAITDFSTYAYLADVFILPEFQGQGLGTWLVKTILEHPELQGIRRWTLYTKDAHDLYRRFGFEAEPDPQRYMIYRP